MVKTNDTIDTPSQKAQKPSSQVSEKPIKDAPKQELLTDIDPEFLIKSEQNKLKRREKNKKFKNLWKDHMKVLKEMDDEEKVLMNAAKRKTLELAERLEYEDEYDDVELEMEKQVSKPAADITDGKFPPSKLHRNLRWR